MSTMVEVVVANPQQLFSQPPSAQDEALRQEIIAQYNGLYYYSAVANFWATRSLPWYSAYDNTDGMHIAARKMIDRSFVDFTNMANVLQNMDREELNSNALSHLLDETIDIWGKLVQDADSYWDRQKEHAEEIAAANADASDDEI